MTPSSAQLTLPGFAYPPCSIPALRQQLHHVAVLHLCGHAPCGRHTPLLPAGPAAEEGQVGPAAAPVEGNLLQGRRVTDSCIWTVRRARTPIVFRVSHSDAAHHITVCSRSDKPDQHVQLTLVLYRRSNTFHCLADAVGSLPVAVLLLLLPGSLGGGAARKKIRQAQIRRRRKQRQPGATSRPQ